jgi:hypothetical protein
MKKKMMNIGLKNVLILLKLVVKQCKEIGANVVEKIKNRLNLQKKRKNEKTRFRRLGEEEEEEEEDNGEKEVEEVNYEVIGILIHPE